MGGIFWRELPWGTELHLFNGLGTFVIFRIVFNERGDDFKVKVLAVGQI